MKTWLLLPLFFVAAKAFSLPLVDTSTVGTDASVPFGYTGDTPENTLDDDQDGTVDEPDFIVRAHTVGQTFQLVPGLPVLSQIAVRRTDAKLNGVIPSHDIDAPFTLVVMTWDAATSRPVGDVLFQSSTLLTPQDGTTQDHVVATGNLLLDPAKTYVAFLILDVPEPPFGNHSLSAVKAREGDPYAGGNLVFKSQGTLGLGGVGAEAWTVSGSRDLSIVIEATGVGSGYSADTSAGTVAYRPFGTQGDIPGNFIDDDQNAIVDEGFAAPLHHHTIAQTFVAPSNATALEAATFVFKDTLLVAANPDAEADASFKVTVSEWDSINSLPIGVPLFEVEPVSFGQTGADAPVNLFTAAAIPMVPGKTYVIIASISNLGLEVGNHSLCTVAVRTDDPYPGGSMFSVSDNDRDPESLLVGPWQTETGDIAGSLVFSEIDPAADANGDGLTDAWVAAYGIDPSVDYSAIVEAIRAAHRAEIQADPGTYGLYDETSIQDLRFSGIMVARTGPGADFQFTIETSDDLDAWDDFETIQRSIPLSPDKFFLRIQANPPQGE